jgi:hypothetical protein
LSAALHPLRILGFIGLGLVGQEPDEVPGMTCAEVGEFARQVAEQKANGALLADALRRLHESVPSGHVDRQRALEDIVKAIYRIEIFSTASPEEVGRAYSFACEIGLP